MKRIILLLMAVVCIVAMSAQDTAQKKKTKRIFIIEGLFFNEIPVDYSLTSGLISIKTANGTSAYGMLLKKPLPEEAKKFAVPSDSIPEADVLLAQFEEKKSTAISYSIAREETVKAGDKFPKFEATDIDGRVWTNADVKGKVMVLNCWFTGCGPCRKEMPELSKWKDEMPDVMFFSSTYEDKATAMPVLEAQGFNWIAIINDKEFKKMVGNNGYPLTIVVDKEGVIRQVEWGSTPTQHESLKQTIQSLR